MIDANFNLAWLTKQKSDIVYFHKLMGSKGSWPHFENYPYMDIQAIDLGPNFPKSFLVVRLDEGRTKIVLFYPVPSEKMYRIGTWRFVVGEKNAEGVYNLSAHQDLNGLLLNDVNQASEFLSLFQHKEGGRGKEFAFRPL